MGRKIKYKLKINILQQLMKEQYTLGDATAFSSLTLISS